MIAFTRTEKCSRNICPERLMLGFANGTDVHAVGPTYPDERRVVWLPDRSSRVTPQRATRLTPMDVLVLIDKLDDLVHNAKAVPLTDQVRIDREEIYEILDQMRATTPRR